MAGQVAVGHIVAQACQVAFAVGDVFEDRRNRILLGVIGQPEACRKANPVRHSDQQVLHLFDLARKGIDLFHASPLGAANSKVRISRHRA